METCITGLSTNVTASGKVDLLPLYQFPSELKERVPEAPKID
jgi:hypothetical protein